ncbi:MAG: metallophosphoesterase family protein, partial [Planctomycetota bacterium]
MSQRLIAIGDIHGCAHPLNVLLDLIQPSAEDLIVTLGDYVDRGPDSKGVVDRLIELGNHCKFVALKGNHEEMMLDVVQDRKPHERWLQFGGVSTLDSYGFMGDLNIFSEAHIAFYAAMVDFFETDNHFFVHANY